MTSNQPPILFSIIESESSSFLEIIPRWSIAFRWSFLLSWRQFHRRKVGDALARISIVRHRDTRRHWTCCGHRRISWAVGIALSCLVSLLSVQFPPREITRYIYIYISRRLRKIILLLACICLTIVTEGSLCESLIQTRALCVSARPDHFARVEALRFDNAAPALIGSFKTSNCASSPIVSNESRCLESKVSTRVHEENWIFLTINPGVSCGTTDVKDKWIIRANCAR